MPTLTDLCGTRSLVDLAAQVGIPFRRLSAYAAGERPYTPQDRATLAAFFGIAPDTLEAPSTMPTPVTKSTRGGQRAAPTAPPPAPVTRTPRPPDAPPPTAIVTNQGTAEARVTGTLQSLPEPELGPKKSDQREARFWLLDILVPHQPLRGAATFPPLRVRCAVHRRFFDSFRWLTQGDRVVVLGVPAPRNDHLYIAATALSTPRAERLRQLRAAHTAGDAEAATGLHKLLGENWERTLAQFVETAAHNERPSWEAQAGAVTGPHGRIQVTITGQLQADPHMELDESGGIAELRFAIAPPEHAARLPVARYRVMLRPRALRGYTWLQRGDSVTVAGDLVSAGNDIHIDATTLHTD